MQHRCVAIAAALAALSPSVAGADAQFDDQTCPNVTPLGRFLNGIVDSSKVLTDELMVAARALVDGYRECVRGYSSALLGTVLAAASE